MIYLQEVRVMTDFMEEGGMIRLMEAKEMIRSRAALATTRSLAAPVTTISLEAASSTHKGSGILNTLGHHLKKKGQYPVGCTIRCPE
jgi:hypothetical protein